MSYVLKGRLPKKGKEKSDREKNGGRSPPHVPPRLADTSNPYSPSPRVQTEKKGESERNEENRRSGTKMLKLDSRDAGRAGKGQLLIA